MQLDTRLAQHIAERSKSSINMNVNVMNAQAIIIGSSDPERIGTLHEGAMLALSQARIVTIDTETADQLRGVKPGVNLPLYFQGKIIGVLGLTGDPIAVKPYGELMKAMAEMMLEQAELMLLLERDSRLRDAIVLALIHHQPLSDHLKDWVSRLGINLAIPRVAILIDMDTHRLNIDDALIEVRRLQTYLHESERDILIGTLAFNQWVILKPALDHKGKWHAAAFQQKIHALHSDLSQLSSCPIKIALGHFFEEQHDIGLSYQTACATMRIAQKQATHDVLYFYEDYALAVLLADLQQSWQGAELSKPLQLLEKQDPHRALYQTLICWFLHHGHTATTAQAMHIHRNTLDYRLKRIESICQCDLTHLDDRLKLYLALQIQGALH